MSTTDNNDNYLKELLSMTKIGTWDLDIATSTITFSDTWTEIVGYTAEELKPISSALDKLILPEDMEYICSEIQKHIDGNTPFFEAKSQMKCKDGTVIWVKYRGKITDFNQDKNPLRFVGVLQDITNQKIVEDKLKENQETLDLAVKIAELGTWDWDIAANVVSCNDEYLAMLQCSREEFKGTIEEWIEMIHPEDRDKILGQVNDYMMGKSPKLECEMRMRRKDGHYIWTRDMGMVVEKDKDGNATRIVGGRLNINMIKRSEEKLNETLIELESHKKQLEKEVEERTNAITVQDNLLWAVNDISQKLFSIDQSDDLDDVIMSSLKSFCKAAGKDRVTLWKNKMIDDEPSCSLLYEYTTLGEHKSLNIHFADLISEQELLKTIEYLDVKITDDEMSILLSNHSDEDIPYSKYMPIMYKAFSEGNNLNSLTTDLNGFEKLQMFLRGVKSFLASPIIINDQIWGFIGIDNFKTEESFSQVEEKVNSIVGFFLANAIEKIESEKQAREAEERVQLMLDATPLCCNFWTRDFENMTCNEEAVRLFDLSSQQEYLDRFFELSPEYQPCGKLSSEMAVKYVTQAFDEGFCKFEWLHQKLDGTPVPAEITLVRVKYKDDYIVSGYTRDLREHKAMLAKLQAKEDDLRAARDEALLNSKAKSNFLANMSHEIRTPMNAISGFGEILLRESKDRQTAEHAIGIKNACTNLLNIVNDILDISKIESGKLEIFESEYELSSLLNDVITISQMRLGDKPLMFITNIDSKLPAVLIGDDIRIKQILINLLSNAIKFTESGHIALRVSGRMEDNIAKLCFEVQDTGTGIKDSDLEVLFAAFQRVNTTKNRNIEGTGLGLAISKQLCEMMHGEIKVQSTYGKGSTFTVEISQKYPEYTQLANLNSPKNVLIYEQRNVYLQSLVETINNLGCSSTACFTQSDLNENITLQNYDFIITSSIHYQKVENLIKRYDLQTKLIIIADYGQNIKDPSVNIVFSPASCLQLASIFNEQKQDNDYATYDNLEHKFVAPTVRVLVVDDNTVNLKVASGLMAPYQFGIDTAMNGIEAVEMIKTNKYDLVFMDHMMPEMDGIDATIEIRKMDDEYYQQLPIIALTANALVGTREMFINEGMNDFLAKPIEVSKLGNILSRWIPSEKKITVLNVIPEDDKNNESINEIFGVDVDQGIKSIGGNKDDYLQILSYYYSDGVNKKASLLQHFTNKDITSFRIEVHALKSTSATIGAYKLGKMAAALEKAAIELNLDFIDENIMEFIDLLQKILESIETFLNEENDSTNDSMEDELPLGNLATLSTELDELYEAAEYIQISEIERIIAILDTYQWNGEILDIINEIKSFTQMFDYDNLIESVKKLKNML